MFIKVLPKDKCIEIAKVIGHSGDSDDSLLCYLPDHVFGQVLKVKKFYVSYEAFDNLSDDTWDIPPYFIKEVFDKEREIIHHD